MGCWKNLKIGESTVVLSKVNRTTVPINNVKLPITVEIDFDVYGENEIGVTVRSDIHVLSQEIAKHLKELIKPFIPKEYYDGIVGTPKIGGNVDDSEIDFDVIFKTTYVPPEEELED